MAPVTSIDRNLESPQPIARPAVPAARCRSRSRQRADRGAHAQPGGADPAARRPHRRGRRQAAAPDADLGFGAGCAATDGERHIALAAAVEFIHTATLLHDDVVDASDLRRGRDTANAVWGNKPAVLVGDFLFARSFELMVEDGSLRILEILSHAAAVIAEGEVGSAGHRQRHDDERSGLSRDHRGENGRAFRRGEPDRRGHRRTPAGRGGGARALRPQSRDRLPADRRHARFFSPSERARQVGRRRFPRRQDHPADRHSVRPGRCRGARLLAAHARRGRTGPGRSRTRDPASRATRRAGRNAGCAPAFYAAEAARALAPFAAGPLRRALVETTAFATARAF